MPHSWEEVAKLLSGTASREVLTALDTPHSDASRQVEQLRELAALADDELQLAGLLLTDVAVDQVFDADLWVQLMRERLAAVPRDADPRIRREVLDDLWRELSRPLRRWFYEFAADVLADAAEHPEQAETPAETQASGSAQTVARERARPTQQPAEKDWQLLERFNATLRDIYVLAEFAGRTPQEIAELVQAAPEIVEQCLTLSAGLLSSRLPDH